MGSTIPLELRSHMCLAAKTKTERGWCQIQQRLLKWSTAKKNSFKQNNPKPPFLHGTLISPASFFTWKVEMTKDTYSGEAAGLSVQSGMSSTWHQRGSGTQYGVIHNMPVLPPHSHLNTSVRCHTGPLRQGQCRWSLCLQHPV